MRLDVHQVQTIRDTVHQLCGNGTTVTLFGSRLDDQRRGGDVDLLLETPDDVSVVQRARLKVRLEAALGLPIDLLVAPANREPTAFQRIARQSGVRL